MTTINDLTEYAGDAPLRTQDQATFNTNMGTALSYLVGFGTDLNLRVAEFNTVAGEVNTAKTDAESAKTAAESAQTVAVAAKNSAEAASVVAESARDATLAAFDSFDDRYLGAKTSDPALDNDGDPLVAGMLYYNTSIPEMRLYTGASWVAAYVSGGGFLIAASNLSDVSSPAQALTNLGGLASTLKGAVGGLAELDGSGKVPAGQLPSYVDDVIEAANFAALPGTGDAGKIYITLDNNTQYRWSGTVYVEITSSPGTTDDVPEGSSNLYFTTARVGTAISGAVEKTSAVAADKIGITDSTAGHQLKWLSWTNLMNTVTSAIGSFINNLTAKGTPRDNDVLVIGDSAASYASKKVTWGSLKSTLSFLSASGIMDYSGSMRQTIYNITSNIDCSLGNYYTKAMSTSFTLTFSNVPPGNRSYAAILRLDYSSGKLTLPASCKFEYGLPAPTLVSGRSYLMIFHTEDSGGTWRTTVGMEF